MVLLAMIYLKNHLPPIASQPLTSHTTLDAQMRLYGYAKVPLHPLHSSRASQHSTLLPPLSVGMQAVPIKMNSIN
jgi:hypothetical protein